MLSICLKRYQLRPYNLVDFFLDDLIRLGHMECELLDLFRDTLSCNKEDFFVVASDHVPTHHLFRWADDLEELLVERGLYDAVVELNDEHVLLHTAQPIS